MKTYTERVQNPNFHSYFTQFSIFDVRSTIFVPSKKLVAPVRLTTAAMRETVFRLARVHDKLCQLLSRTNKYCTFMVSVIANCDSNCNRFGFFFKINSTVSRGTIEYPHDCSFLFRNIIRWFDRSKYTNALDGVHFCKLRYSHLFTESSSNECYRTLWISGKSGKHLMIKTEIQLFLNFSFTGTIHGRSCSSSPHKCRKLGYYAEIGTFFNANHTC